MKLGDILRKVGGGLIRTAVPGGGLLLGAVNALLPSDKQLGTDATGEDVGTSLAGLPPGLREKALIAEYDVDIKELEERGSTLRTMLESDALRPHTTRPKIVMRSFYIVAGATSMIISGWMYAVVTENQEMVTRIMDGWPWIAVLLLPFIELLRAYFGILKMEHRDRIAGASGSPVGGSVIGSILKAIKG